MNMTPAFKKWFGNSKVVDAKGRPLVVYHGTRNVDEFHSFDTDGSHIGSHFSEKAGPARYYARGKKGRMIRAYLSIQNPWVTQDLGRWDDVQVAQEWARQQGIPDYKNVRAILPILEDIRSHVSKFKGIHDGRAMNAGIKDWLMSRGYDGIRYLNRYESGKGDVVVGVEWAERALAHLLPDDQFIKKFPDAPYCWIAFHPVQIKAVNNDGTFDKDDPDIRSNPAVETVAPATKAFQKWFGDSKMIDEDGNPLVVYRGDTEDFNQFDRSKTRENGFFFTTEEKVARGYAKGGLLRAFYIRAKKVLNLMEDTRESRRWVREWSENFDEWVDRESGEEMDPFDILQGGRMFDYEGDWSSERWLDIQAQAENQGYDAVILPDYDSDIGIFPAVVVFDPRNIKLVDNDGSFDMSDPDVRSNPEEKSKTGVIASANGYVLKSFRRDGQIRYRLTEPNGLADTYEFERYAYSAFKDLSGVSVEDARKAVENPANDLQSMKDGYEKAISAKDWKAATVLAQAIHGAIMDAGGKGAKQWREKWMSARSAAILGDNP